MDSTVADEQMGQIGKVPVAGQGGGERVVAEVEHLEVAQVATSAWAQPLQLNFTFLPCNYVCKHRAQGSEIRKWMQKATAPGPVARAMEPECT